MRSYEEILADAAEGRPFSNHTEYELWADSGRGCYDCANDDDAAELWCPILTVALLGNWPKEWPRERSKVGAFDVAGECTEFRQRPEPGDEPEPDPEPPPVCDGQLDLIDAYLETALAELTPKPVEVS
jgi:hypothetical protein